MKEIKRYLQDRIGSYSFYFEDLKSKYVYGYNENVVMTAAGCMKLPIAISLLKAVEDGNIDISQYVTVNDEDMVFGTGILHEFSAREYSIKELLVAMLIQSDNTAANKIIDLLGMEAVNKTAKDMGLNNTILNRKTIDERTDNTSVQNHTTSFDISKCWRVLYNQSYINEEHSQYIIEVLKREQIKNKIIYYYPDEIKQETACKSGDINSVENDTALIKTSKGTFIFTIMSKDLPTNTYGLVTIARAGKMVLDIIENGWS